ncbi:hypothetical protein ACF1AX_18685 [Streptomyces sp. NPDC014802]|uniref:hypothetical protein n=1 Tax=Streptomyces sp. NPDC014802 TaxID=3364917 RepID=UPI0036FCA6AA
MSALKAPVFPYPMANAPIAEKDGPDLVVRAAFVLQDQQNTADEKWVETLGLDPEVAEEILTRLGRRGACWLDFITDCVDYRGDFHEITDEMLDKGSPTA